MNGWWRQTFWGAVHLTPIGDERMHTVPMCWCPVRVHGYGTLHQFHEHFSVQEIREGKHNRRGILK
jgi:hypothetical protein